MKKIIKKLKKYILRKKNKFVVFVRQWILIIRMSFFFMPLNKMYYMVVLKYKISMLLFHLKSLWLALKYKINLKTIVKHIIFFCLVSLGCWYVVSLPENKLSVALYAGLGFIFSLYATYLYEKAVKLHEEVSYLPITSQIISSIYGVTEAIFMSFFNHPLDDAICKKGDNIIYVSPCNAGGGYDEAKMVQYTRFIDNISFDDFWAHFRQLNTRHLIKTLKEQSPYFNNAYTLVLNRKDSIDVNLFMLFTQFYQALNTFMFLDLLKWEDLQVKTDIFIKTKLLINKTDCTLLLAQREIQKIKPYTEYIASKPANNEKKLLEGAKEVEQRIIEESKEYFEKIQKFGKKEQECIMDKFVNIQTFLGTKNKIIKEIALRGKSNAK